MSFLLGFCAAFSATIMLAWVKRPIHPYSRPAKPRKPRNDEDCLKPGWGRIWD